MTNGFFIEAGAHDGEDYSNSLLFEMKRNWTGILIEADPFVFQKMQSRNRRAFVVNAGLAIVTYSTQVTFLSSGLVGGISDLPVNDNIQRLREERVKKTHIPMYNITVQCFPLFSILLLLVPFI